LVFHIFKLQALILQSILQFPVWKRLKLLTFFRLSLHCAKIGICRFFLLFFFFELSKYFLNWKVSFPLFILHESLIIEEGWCNRLSNMSLFTALLSNMVCGNLLIYSQEIISIYCYLFLRLFLQPLILGCLRRWIKSRKKTRTKSDLLICCNLISLLLLILLYYFVIVLAFLDFGLFNSLFRV
jgi:hypothetical protein